MTATKRILACVAAACLAGLGAFPLSAQTSPPAQPKAVAELKAAARAAEGKPVAVVAAAWRAVVEAAPTDAEAWRRLGFLLHMAGDYAGALPAHRRVAELEPSVTASYNLGCTLARLGKKDEAFAALGDAIAAGFADAEHSKQDEDLESLHGDARFAPLLERMRKAETGRKDAAIKVAVLVYPGVELLDFAGPLEAFASAHGRDGMAFRAFTVARSKEPLRTQGTRLVADYDFDDCPQPRIVVIPGGSVGAVVDHAPTMAWLEKVRPGLDVGMSVCNGALVLARLGALDGRRATTHWSAMPRLRDGYPKVTLVPGARFVDTKDIVTAAGVSAGIDGALHLIDRYCGREVAWETAHYMEYEWRPDRVGPYGLDDASKRTACAAIGEAVQHYLDGVLRKGGVEHVAASLHERVEVVDIAPGRGENGADKLTARSFADMQKAAREVAAGRADAGPANFEILDVRDAIAVVKLQAPWGVDYLALGRFDGRWLVRQILGQVAAEHDK